MDRKRIITAILYLTLFLTLCFPKAGTKLGALPLYASVILPYCVLLPLLAAAFAKRVKLRSDELTLAILYAAMFSLLVINYLFTGFSMFPSNLGVIAPLSYSLSLVGMIFIFTFHYYPIRETAFKRILLSSIAIIVLYGIIQKLFGETRTIIPGLTFNYSEALAVLNAPSHFWGKHNLSPRLDLLKLSSTYQNGIVFGVSFIMISWFAFHYILKIRKPFSIPVFFLSLGLYTAICFLTYSGSIYVGCLLSLVFYYVYALRRILLSGHLNRRLLIGLMTAVPAVLIVLSLTLLSVLPGLQGIRDAINKLLLRRDLLGNERIGMFTDYIRYLVDNRLWFQFLFGSLFDAGRAGGAYEITLAAVFANSGILFTGFFVYTVFRLLRKLKLEIYNIGLFTYLAVSFIDGAYWLPPTAVVFWTLASASLYLMNGASQNRRIAAAQNQSARAET